MRPVFVVVLDEPLIAQVLHLLNRPLLSPRSQLLLERRPCRPLSRLCPPGRLFRAELAASWVSPLTGISPAPHNARVSRLRSNLLSLVAVVLLAGVASAQDYCAQPISDGEGPIVRDCLYLLKASVGSVTCRNCVCDVDGSGNVELGDALRCLRVALGVDLPLECPACGESTTTLPLCASCGDVLAGAAAREELCALDSIYYEDVLRCQCSCCDRLCPTDTFPEPDYTCDSLTASAILRCLKDVCRDEFVVCYSR